MQKTAVSSIFFVMLIFLACCRSGAAATQDRSYFFASREACTASGLLNPRECAAAFINARSQLMDAPSFSSKDECRLRFRLCDIRRDATTDDAMSYAPNNETLYTPTAIGVEIVISAQGAAAAPTLAIETPRRMFRLFPVSHPYAREHREDGAGAELQNAAILPSDRFEPFSKRIPLIGAASFTTSALGPIATATRATDRAETVEERRRRLKAAPLIE